MGLLVCNAASEMYTSMYTQHTVCMAEPGALLVHCFVRCLWSRMSCWFAGFADALRTIWCGVGMWAKCATGGRVRVGGIFVWAASLEHRRHTQRSFEVQIRIYIKSWLCWTGRLPPFWIGVPYTKTVSTNVKTTQIRRQVRAGVCWKHDGLVKLCTYSNLKHINQQFLLLCYIIYLCIIIP